MILLMSLSGCVINPTKPVIADIGISARYTQKCPDLPDVADPLPMGQLLVEYKNLQQQYTECATNHDGLIETVTKKGSK